MSASSDDIGNRYWPINFWLFDAAVLSASCLKADSLDSICLLYFEVGTTTTAVLWEAKFVIPTYEKLLFDNGDVTVDPEISGFVNVFIWTFFI